MTRRHIGLGAAIAGGNPKNGRQADDFYPTPPDVTRALCTRYADVLHGGVVWEPCAGDGAMMDEIKRCCRNVVVGSDIEPRRADISKLDVLADDGPAFSMIITNPPFKIAEKIIHKVLNKKRPTFFALVLKATFWHAQRRRWLFLNHRPYAIHPLLWRPDFLGLGAPTMDVMWCVWRYDEDGSYMNLYTAYEPLDRPSDWSY
jgi:hypothetical protein